MENASIRQNVEKVYVDNFGTKPEWIVRCPGRVNIIGEHVDYSDYSVLPMAIQQATYIAVGRSDDHILHFVNAEPEKYESFDFEIGLDVFQNDRKPTHATLKWFHYFVAGWRGTMIEKVFEMYPFYGVRDKFYKSLSGLNVAVASSIPPSAGLSSSSALVCASVLATLLIFNRIPYDCIDKTEVAQIAIKHESYIGVEGGGMDQACECLAEKNVALRIDFRPLKTTEICLPENALFAVLHSGIEMNKAATAYYNQRVVECRIAAQILSKKCKKNVEWFSIRTLKQAAEICLPESSDPHDMLPLVKKHLEKVDKSPHTRQEILELLEIKDDEELVKYSLNSNTEQMQEFWLSKRARHVYSEAARVLEFEKICSFKNASVSTTTVPVLNQLARLMNESHASCRDDFECSCPELDSLVERCVRELPGCLAARLTGAGWGGCVVTLIDKTKSKMNEEAEAESINLPKILFWSEASDGICAFQP